MNTLVRLVALVPTGPNTDHSGCGLTSPNQAHSQTKPTSMPFPGLDFPLKKKKREKEKVKLIC